MTETTQRFFDARPESIGEARAFTVEALAEGAGPAGSRRGRPALRLRARDVVHGTALGHGFLVKIDADEEVVRREVHDSRRQNPRPARPPTRTRPDAG
jgi:hypothetical protein